MDIRLFNFEQFEYAFESSSLFQWIPGLVLDPMSMLCLCHSITKSFVLSAMQGLKWVIAKVGW